MSGLMKKANSDHTTLPLFLVEPTARPTDPITSHIAAAGIKSKSATMRDTMVRLLKHADIQGLTAQDVADQTGWLIQSVTPRFRELERRGLIKRTAVRRKGSTGTTRIVWQALD